MIVKVQILTQCEDCEGEAYLPAGEADSNTGETYMRYELAQSVREVPGKPSGSVCGNLLTCLTVLSRWNLTGKSLLTNSSPPSTPIAAMQLVSNPPNQSLFRASEQALFLFKEKPK